MFWFHKNFSHKSLILYFFLKPLSTTGTQHLYLNDTFNTSSYGCSDTLQGNLCRALYPILCFPVIYLVIHEVFLFHISISPKFSNASQMIKKNQNRKSLPLPKDMQVCHGHLHAKRDVGTRDPRGLPHALHSPAPHRNTVMEIVISGPSYLLQWPWEQIPPWS